MDSTSVYGTICGRCSIAPLPIVSPALTEADVRRIVREELALATTEHGDKIFPSQRTSRE